MCKLRHRLGALAEAGFAAYVQTSTRAHGVGLQGQRSMARMHDGKRRVGTRHACFQKAGDQLSPKAAHSAAVLQRAISPNIDIIDTGVLPPESISAPLLAVLAEEFVSWPIHLPASAGREVHTVGSFKVGCPC